MRPVARTLEPEDRIARYRIVGPLGAGGMGEVYIARDETLDRSVALKILPPGLVRNDERVRRFVTEAKSASSLNHPNIVTIYEIGHDRVLAARPAGEADAGASAPGTDGEGAAEAVHYIAMELVVGETLDQKIHHEKTDLRTLLGWIAQAAEGIAKAHAAGIVHRDLKPGNIMISKDGFAKVLDFGLAKLTERGVTDAERTSAPTQAVATGAGVVMGTVGYMSPEQVQAKSVDHRSDIFSLGCILYEAATRRRPFVADSDIEVMHLILKEKPPAIEEVNPEVPGEVRRLVRRCLAKSPDQRFQSMKDLAIELREAVEEWDTLSTSTPSGSTAPGSGSGVVPRGRAVNLGVIAAMVIGLAGAGFGAYALLNRGSGAGAGGAAATTLQDLRMTVLLSRDDLSESALSSDGRYLAYVTNQDRTASLKVRQVRTGSDVVIVPESEQEINGVAFSRDGDYLYYLNRDPDSPNYQALYQVPSLGGSPRKIVFDVDSAPTFSPDGKQACFRRGLAPEGADSLVIVDLDTLKERTLLRVEGEGVEAPPAWSPDGKTIVVGLQQGKQGVQTTIAAIDVASGRRTTIGPKNWVDIGTLGWMPDGRGLLASVLDPKNGTAYQVYRVAFPGGETLRLTNDLDGYTNVSVAADGSAACIRGVTVDNLWVARPETKEEPRALTFASGSASSVLAIQPLPDGSVAFSAPRENRTSLWRMEADGSNRRQITSQGGYIANVRYAEKAGLVFTQVDAEEPYLLHVWRADADGGGLKQLTDGHGEQLRNLSPAGDWMVYEPFDDPRHAFRLRRLDGGEPRPFEPAVGEQPQFSYDGRRLLWATFEETEGRFFPRHRIMDVASGREESTFRLSPGAIDVQWAPDGKSITYVDRARGWTLMRKAVPDGDPVALTSFPDGQVVDHTWSPDGSRLVVHRRIGSRDSLWMLKAGAKEPVLMTEFKTGRVTRHLWAPDAPILYFVYGNSTQDVVVISGVK